MLSPARVLLKNSGRLYIHRGFDDIRRVTILTVSELVVLEAVQFSLYADYEAATDYSVKA